MLPTGSKPIVEARIAGKRPADLLIVSMVGRVPETNPVILADGDDWRFLEGLEVCVFTKRGKPFRELCKQIAFNGPKSLWLWDVENWEGATVRLWLDPDKIYKKRFTIDDYMLDIDPWGRIANRDFEDV